MEKTPLRWILLSFMLIIVSIPALNAKVSDEAYWQRRSMLARERLLKAYKPNPEIVVHKINQNTQEALEHHFAETAPGNSTNRRELGRKYTGKCMATNPIDRCWRCDPNWAKNRTARRRYADCAQGFGSRAIGGKYGPTYVVTDPSDNDMVNPKPGTLRHAVIQNGPLWIVFKRNMDIRLNLELIMTSNKTIDGRGKQIRLIGGAGITIQYVHNIIISNIKINNICKSPGGTIRSSVNHFGFRTQSDGDAISIYGSHDIWLDHLSMSTSDDGLIDAIMGSTAITISNCHFTRHDKALLFGGRDFDEIDSRMQITLAYNHFGRFLTQRMPRCRRGFFHLVNNDYNRWEMYAIGGSHNATIISQGNRYVAPDDINKKRVTHREADSPESEWRKWMWVTDQDQLQNGAVFIASGNPMQAKRFMVVDKMKPASGRHAHTLTRFAGHLACKRSKPC